MATSVHIEHEDDVLCPLLKHDPPTTLRVPSHLLNASHEQNEVSHERDRIVIADKNLHVFPTQDQLSIPAARLISAKQIAQECHLQPRRALIGEGEAHPIASRHGAKLDRNTRRAHQGHKVNPFRHNSSAANFGFSQIQTFNESADAAMRRALTAAAVPSDVETPIFSRTTPSSMQGPPSIDDVLPLLMRSELSDSVSILQVIFPPRVKDTTSLPKDVTCRMKSQEAMRDDKTILWDTAVALVNAETSEHPTHFPEKEITVEYVSTTPANRRDVTELHEALCNRLRKRQANPVGICPIRREVYDDVFCELIRQITLEDPARGVLLKRIKDEADHTMELHSRLVERAHRFSSRKQLECQEATVQSLVDRVEALRREIKELEIKKHDRLKICQSVGKKIDEDRAAIDKAQKQELAYWRKANQQLSIKLKADTERISNGRPSTTTPPPPTDKLYRATKILSSRNIAQ